MSTNWFSKTDKRITLFLAKNGPTLLRIALGIIFFWFGVIKFIPNLSPADELAARTITSLSAGLVPPNISRPILATWETLIGLGLLSGQFLRATLLLLAVQMLGTVTPLFLFPEVTWRQFPIALTLEGQYIVKNIVLVAAAFVIGATVRGGAMVASPQAAARAKREDEIEATEQASRT